jgi:hypothetical protein
MALLSEAFADQSREEPELAPVEWDGSRSGRLDPEDSARLLAGFHGLPQPKTPSLHYVRSSADGQASAYAWDEDTGMVYILD